MLISKASIFGARAHVTQSIDLLNACILTDIRIPALSVRTVSCSWCCPIIMWTVATCTKVQCVGSGNATPRRHHIEKLKVKRAGRMGHGLFSVAEIAADSFIVRLGQPTTARSERMMYRFDRTTIFFYIRQRKSQGQQQ